MSVIAGFRKRNRRKCICGWGITCTDIYIDCSINPRATFACKRHKRSRNLHTLFGVVVYWKIYPLLIVMAVYIKYLHLLRTHFQIFYDKFSVTNDLTVYWHGWANFLWQMSVNICRQCLLHRGTWSVRSRKSRKVAPNDKIPPKKVIKTFLKQRTDVGWTFMPLISVDRTIMLYLLFSCFPCRTEHFAVYKGLVCILWVLVFQNYLTKSCYSLSWFSTVRNAKYAVCSILIQSFEVRWSILVIFLDFANWSLGN